VDSFYRRAATHRSSIQIDPADSPRPSGAAAIGSGPRTTFPGLAAPPKINELPRSMLCGIASGVLALQLVTAARLLAQETSVQALLATRGDFTGLIDIGGGRHIYLECRGTGSPTVVLEAGYRAWPLTPASAPTIDQEP
jgi:hypothetical protein